MDIQYTDAELLSFFRCRSIGESFNKDDWMAREVLFKALELISHVARSDGQRTFDDCIHDLGVIDDMCRRLLAQPIKVGG